MKRTLLLATAVLTTALTCSAQVEAFKDTSKEGRRWCLRDAGTGEILSDWYYYIKVTENQYPIRSDIRILEDFGVAIIHDRANANHGHQGVINRRGEVILPPGRNTRIKVDSTDRRLYQMDYDGTSGTFHAIRCYTLDGTLLHEWTGEGSSFKPSGSFTLTDGTVSLISSGSQLVLTKNLRPMDGLSNCTILHNKGERHGRLVARCGERWDNHLKVLDANLEVRYECFGCDIDILRGHPTMVVQHKDASPPTTELRSMDGTLLQTMPYVAMQHWKGDFFKGKRDADEETADLIEVDDRAYHIRYQGVDFFSPGGSISISEHHQLFPGLEPVGPVGSFTSLGTRDGTYIVDGNLNPTLLNNQPIHNLRKYIGHLPSNDYTIGPIVLWYSRGNDWYFFDAYHNQEHGPYQGVWEHATGLEGDRSDFMASDASDRVWRFTTTPEEGWVKVDELSPHVVRSSGGRLGVMSLSSRGWIVPPNYAQVAEIGGFFWCETNGSKHHLYSSRGKLLWDDGSLLFDFIGSNTSNGTEPWGDCGMAPLYGAALRLRDSHHPYTLADGRTVHQHTDRWGIAHKDRLLIEPKYMSISMLPNGGYSAKYYFDRLGEVEFYCDLYDADGILLHTIQNARVDYDCPSQRYVLKDERGTILRPLSSWQEALQIH